MTVSYFQNNFNLESNTFRNVIYFITNCHTVFHTLHVRISQITTHSKYLSNSPRVHDPNAYCLHPVFPSSTRISELHPCSWAPFVFLSLPFCSRASPLFFSQPKCMLMSLPLGSWAYSFVSELHSAFPSLYILTPSWASPHIFEPPLLFLTIPLRSSGYHSVPEPTFVFQSHPCVPELHVVFLSLSFCSWAPSHVFEPPLVFLSLPLCSWASPRVLEPTVVSLSLTACFWASPSVPEPHLYSWTSPRVPEPHHVFLSLFPCSWASPSVVFPCCSWSSPRFPEPTLVLLSLTPDSWAYPYIIEPHSVFPSLHFCSWASPCVPEHPSLFLSSTSCYWAAIRVPKPPCPSVPEPQPVFLSLPFCSWVTRFLCLNPCSWA